MSRTMWLMPLRNSERTRVNRRASAASFDAYASAPTRVALVVAGPGGDEAARQHFVAWLLDDRVGLTGEQALVDLEAR